ncbi:hypothetical protein SMACR_12813 [Sordaria macrospora]|uniref:WGS project CABT00000000 data, contig 2.7 n=2 Tax=Sordaria macrospora TaxID=5147 RepID=F7VUC9_SORMK|nr:uncharacterized protein SMAC_12813 [Sordaria macrospora k-hell]KAA8632470.1 hypothetical protein SMACR_12813 [Sordaria macrospora]WPJ61890.1 hypothetical protein SMAC4_12813 [Sordaria macrospora]CCC09118.1 unnamed protein product [Sordaria macrospora k-hell]
MSDNAADSPLSTVSNVVGLFTFTLGLLTLVVTFLSITHSAEKEMGDIDGKLKARKDHIQHIKVYFDRLEREAHRDWEGSSIRGNFLMTLDTIKQHHRTATAELQKNSKSHHWWWYYRPDVMGAVEAMETQFQHLNTIQLTFLLITTRSQEDNISEIEATLNKVKRELRKLSDSSSTTTSSSR